MNPMNMNTFRTSRVVPLLFALLAASVVPTTALSQRAAAFDNLFQPANVPSDLRPYVVALGNRVRNPGQEQVVLDGQLTDANGTRDARVVQQLPRLIRLEGFKSGDAILAFDGALADVRLTLEEQDVLESFVADTAEGFLAALRDGAGARFLGGGFGPDPRAQPDYDGPRFDIFEVAEPVPTRTSPITRNKRYYFDTDTGLLVRTRYRDARGASEVVIETRFPAWTRSPDGSAYPGRIERYENDELKLSFSVGAYSTQPETDSSAFRIP